MSLFLLVSGVGCDFCLWLFLDFILFTFLLQERFGLPCMLILFSSFDTSSNIFSDPEIALVMDYITGGGDPAINHTRLVSY